MTRILAILSCLLATTAARAEWPPEILAASKMEHRAVSTDGFRDAISHWQKKYGRDRDDRRYEEEDIIHIAEALLSYQNEDGGWPKDVDWLAIIAREEMDRIMDPDFLKRSTFDNRSTYTQVEYLATVHSITGLERYGNAAGAGLEYILRQQRASGGWRGYDVDAITFNDSVMTGIMSVLRDIVRGEEHYAWINEHLRARVSEAYRRGLAATLACQIRVDGVLTGWCQQHSHDTFAPVKARSYELPSIGGLETVDVTRFLMEIREPSPEVISAIEGACSWLERSAIYGMRLDRVKIDPVRYDNHTTDVDVVIVPDPEARRLWARYYDLETQKPFFANRDGSIVHSLAEVHHERRTGYGWYGVWGESLLTKQYPAWRVEHERP